MADHVSARIPFPVLTFVLPKDYQQTLVQHALMHRGEVTPQARKCLEEAIRAEVQIKGFRDSATAPLPLLVKEVVKRYRFSNRVFKGVLQVWMESHDSLQTEVR